MSRRGRKVRFTSDEVVAMINVLRFLDADQASPGMVWTDESKAVICKAKAVGPNDTMSIIR